MLGKKVRNQLVLARDMGILALLILVVAVRLGLGADKADDFARIYQEAQVAQTAGDTRTASAKFEQLIALRPDIAELRANLGLLYYQLGEATRALESLQHAARQKPDLPGVDLYIGILLFSQDRFQETLDHLFKAEKLNPSDPKAHLYLGFTHYSLSHYLEAVRYLEKVPLQVQVEAEVLYVLSKAYAQLSRKYHNLLKENFSESFYLNLARAHYYVSQQSWQKAAEEYQEALRKNPNDPNLKREIEWVAWKSAPSGTSFQQGLSGEIELSGIIRFMDSRPSSQKAREELLSYQARLQELRKHSLDSPQNVYILAEGHQVISYLALIILEAQPNPYHAHQLKAASYEELGENEKAIAEYRRALELKPDLRNIHFAIGNLFWKMWQYDQALPELEAELKINERHPVAHYEVGEILLRKGQLDAALNHLNRSLELDERLFEAHLSLERIYSMKGDHEKALSHLRRAVELAPEDPSPHYKMAAIYEKLGRDREATKEMEIFQRLSSPARGVNQR